MKLSNETLQAHFEVIKVDDYRLVAALRAMGLDIPHRQTAYTSEMIAEDFLDEVVNNSSYIYPRTREVLKAIRYIEKNGLEIKPERWSGHMDELKMFFGVGSSSIENYSEREFVKTPGKKPVKVYSFRRVGL